MLYVKKRAYTIVPAYQGTSKKEIRKAKQVFLKKYADSYILRVTIQFRDINSCIFCDYFSAGKKLGTELLYEYR